VDDASAQAGRIVITAAKRFGTRGVGIDIDPAQIREARENAVKAGVADKVKFLHVHKLARPQTYAKRLKIFARGSELAAGDAPHRGTRRHTLWRHSNCRRTGRIATNAGGPGHCSGIGPPSGRDHDKSPWLNGPCPREEVHREQT
jgi:hypothetical protein